MLNLCHLLWYYKSVQQFSGVLVLKGWLRKISLGVAVILVVAEMFFIFPMQVDAIKTAPEAPDVFQNEMPNQAMGGIHLVETKDGQKEWELWASKAIGFKEKGNWDLVDVKVRLFGKTDDIFYLVTGDKGFVKVETRDIIIDGNVVTKSSNGYSIKTETIVYSSSAKKITGPKSVFMTGPARDPGKLKVLGGNLKADLNDSSILIADNVSASRVLQGRDVNIKSRTALFSAANNSAAFEGNVLVESEEMRVTGPKAVFSYERGSDQVKSILVDGGVKVTDAKKWATAKSLDMFFDSDRFVLKGNPRVVQDGDELVGDEIIFSNRGDNIQVKGVKAKFEKKEETSVE